MRLPFVVVCREKHENFLTLEREVRVLRQKLATKPDTERQLATALQDLGKIKITLKTAEENLEVVRCELTTAKQSLAEEKSTTLGLQQKHNKLLQANAFASWAPPALCELPASHVPGYSSVASRTFDLAQKILRVPSVNTASLADPEQFSHRTIWAMYWLFAHAAKSACERALSGVNENGTSSAFEEGLKEQSAQYIEKFGPTADLEIDSALLFEHLKPNLQEVDSGADMVLVVSGEGLTGNGCAKLLWIQAKRYIGQEMPFLMTYGQENSKYGTQCAAIRRQHLPERGSNAFYFHYSVQLPFVTAIGVERLADHAKTADLADHGARLQEMLTAALVADEGQFISVEDAARFLEEISKNSGLALRIMTLSSRGETFGHQLLARLTAKSEQAERNRRGSSPKGV